MRRTLVILAATAATLVAQALPALAATRPEAGVRGSFTGVAIALALGAVFAFMVVAFAYRGADAEDEIDAHHGEAT